MRISTYFAQTKGLGILAVADQAGEGYQCIVPGSSERYQANSMAEISTVVR